MQLVVTLRSDKPAQTSKSHLAFPLPLTLRGHITAPACKSHSTAYLTTAMTVLTGWRRRLWHRLIAGRVCFRCDLWPLASGRERALLSRSPDAVPQRGTDHAQRILHSTVARRLSIASFGHSVLVRGFCRFVRHSWHLILLNDTWLWDTEWQRRGLPALCSTEEYVCETEGVFLVTGEQEEQFCLQITSLAVQLLSKPWGSEVCWEYVVTADILPSKTQRRNFHFGTFIVSGWLSY